MKTKRRKEIFFRFVTPRTVRLTIERQLYRGVLNGALEGGKNGSYVVVKEQKTRSARISYLSEHRTFLPSSISFPHTSLFISLYLYLFSVFDLSRVLSSSFSFLGLRQKELSLLRCFSPIYVEYIHRASPLNAVVPLTYSYIYATTHVSNSLSTYPSIYIYIYTYYYNDTYIYTYIIPLCIALSHARQITEPRVKLANSCAVLELTR